MQAITLLAGWACGTLGDRIRIWGQADDTLWAAWLGWSGGWAGGTLGFSFLTHSVLTCLAKLLEHLGVTFVMVGQLTHFGLLCLAELVAHLGFSSEEGDTFYDTLCFDLLWWAAGTLRGSFTVCHEKWFILFHVWIWPETTKKKTTFGTHDQTSNIVMQFWNMPWLCSKDTACLLCGVAIF